jgi:hypothetical protein
VSHPARGVCRSRSIRRLPTLSSVAVSRCCADTGDVAWPPSLITTDGAGRDRGRSMLNQLYGELCVDTAGRSAVRWHGVSVQPRSYATTELLHGSGVGGRCFYADVAARASEAFLRSRPRFRKPNRLRCRWSQQRRPGLASRSGFWANLTTPKVAVGGSQHATGHSSGRSWCQWPVRWSASGSRECSPSAAQADLLCLLRAARAMAVKSALVSIGRRNSRPSGPHGRWFVSPRGGGHRPRPVERHQEQARMVEHVNRSARDG